MAKIHEQIIKIMEDSLSIGKDRKNSSQGYQFRGIDDVYNSLHDILAKHKVFTVPEVLSEIHEERPTKSGGLSIYRILKIKYTFYTDDGSSFESVVIGEGMDSGDKSSNKAMSVAHKYALLQVFCIPTEDTKDPENDSPQVTGPGVKPTPPKQTNYSKPTSEPTYNKSPYTEETIKKVTSLTKNGLKGKDCLKKYLPDFNAKNNKTYKEIQELDDKELNNLITFINNIPPDNI